MTLIDGDRLNEVVGEIELFRREREWERFHTPKNLIVSIAIEAGELLECVQWKSDKEALEYISGEGLVRVSEEIADVAIYLLLLCNDLGLDISDLISRKLEINRQKYPADKSRGSAKKYDEA